MTCANKEELRLHSQGMWIMSLITTYSQRVTQIRSEIARIQQERTRASQERARLSAQIVTEQNRMSSSSSLSTIKTAAANIDRYTKQLSDCDRKMADADRKISQAQERLNREEQNLTNERNRETESQQRAYEKRMRSMTASLEKTNTSVSKVRSDVDALQKNSRKMRVLFLAANSIDTDRIRLDEEARSIQENIRKSDYRDSIEFITRWAARPLDLIQSINEVSPTIVHFSGHGADSGELVFQGDDGNAKFVQPEAISAAISTAADSVRLVFFNACFSECQARDVVKYIQGAIGMRVSIGDDAARVFASQFYSAIGFGKDLENAFKQARAALLLENIKEENTPVLLLKDGVNPKAITFIKVEE